MTQRFHIFQSVYYLLLLKSRSFILTRELCHLCKLHCTFSAHCCMNKYFKIIHNIIFVHMQSYSTTFYGCGVCFCFVFVFLSPSALSLSRLNGQPATSPSDHKRETSTSKFPQSICSSKVWLWGATSNYKGQCVIYFHIHYRIKKRVYI